MTAASSPRNAATVTCVKPRDWEFFPCLAFGHDDTLLNVSGDE